MGRVTLVQIRDLSEAVLNLTECLDVVSLEQCF